jgi:hypothetical protein
MMNEHFANGVRVITLSVWAAATFTLAVAGQVAGNVPKFTFPEDGRSYGLGDELRIKVVGFSRTEHPKLIARLFHASGKSLQDTFYAITADSQCYIYDADSFTVSAERSDIIVGRSVSDITRGHTDGSWLIVLEEGKWPSGPIKISKETAGEYFGRGFNFFVDEDSYRSPVATRIVEVVAGLIAWIRPPSPAVVRKLPTGSQAANQGSNDKRREAVERLKKEGVCIYFRAAKSSEALTIRQASCDTARPNPVAAAAVEGPLVSRRRP